MSIRHPLIDFRQGKPYIKLNLYESIDMKILRKLNEVLSEVLTALTLIYECIVIVQELMQEVNILF